MKKSWPAGVCTVVSVCVCVFNIFGHSARTAGPIGTGVAPIDAPKRRNDIGAGQRVGGRHVASYASCRRVIDLTKNFIEQPLQVARGAVTDPKLAGHTRTAPT